MKLNRHLLRFTILGIAVYLLVGAAAASAQPGANGRPEPRLRFPEVVVAVEMARDGAPLWTDSQGWNAAGKSLLQELAAAAAHGLNPSDYHGEVLADMSAVSSALMLNRVLTEDDIRYREHLLTDAFLGYGLDRAGGRLATDLMPAKWIKDDRRQFVLDGLQKVLVQDAPERRLPEHFFTGSPLQSQLDYAALQEALRRARARREAGEFVGLAAGGLLRPGRVDPRVPALRWRLVSSGDLAPAARMIPRPGDWMVACLYDQDLVRAVKKFQARHGLAPDAVVGPESLAALNVSASDRVRQIELNLERMRWLPADLGEMHIAVNIPDFSLRVRRQGTTLLKTRAVVGKQKRPTPILSGAISSVVVNPYWNVPQKLARRDLLPKVMNNPQFLSEQVIRVYDTWAPGAAELDPMQLDWTAIKPWDMAYKFRQSPGPDNPLGQVKFMFANPFSVFIHDTNHKEKFASRKRPFSSGCVRIEDPLGLARLLLAEESRHLPEPGQLEELLASRENRWLSLRRKIPVHLMYLTSWVDEAGVLQFREDIYGYDGPLAEALAAHDRAAGFQRVSKTRADAKSEPSRPSHQVRVGPVSTWTKPGPE